MSEPSRRGSTRAIIAVLAACGILSSMTQTLVIPLLGELPQIFSTTPSGASWIVTATLLTGAISTPVLGRLADQYGKKRMLLVALIPLLMGSVLCATATALAPMIVGRALQGFATGTVALGISLLHDVLPAQKVGTGIALMSSSLGVGGAVGLPIAAAVAEFADWRTLFWCVGAAALVVGALVAVIVSAPTTRRAAAPFDGVGALGLAVALTSLLIALSKGGDWGWLSLPTLALLGISVVVAVGWCWYELRARHPLVNLRTTSRPTVLLTNLASVFIGFALYAQSLAIPQMMQLPTSTGYGHGQSMLQMAIWIAPSGLMMMLAAPFAARLSAARGAKLTLITGGIVIAAGYAVATQVTASLWGLASAACVASVGVGFAFGAMPTLVLDAVPEHEKAAANGLNSLMRSLGMTASAAVIGAVLAQSAQLVDARIIPSETGLTAALVIGGGAAVVAALIALGIPTPRHDSRLASRIDGH